MNCPNCGREIPDGSQVCPLCNQILSMAGSAGPGISGSKTSGLAIASLVLGILSLGVGFMTFGLLGLLSLSLGARSLSKIKKSQGALTGRGLAIAGIATGSASLLLLVLIVLVALPDFWASNARTKQSEAKANLMAIHTAELSYSVDFGQYGKTFSELKWTPEKNSTYTYFLSPEESLQPASGGPYQLPAAVSAFVRDDKFQAAAVGNIDRDATLDVWTINESKELTHVIDDYDNSSLLPAGPKPEGKD